MSQLRLHSADSSFKVHLSFIQRWIMGNNATFPTLRRDRWTRLPSSSSEDSSVRDFGATEAAAAPQGALQHHLYTMRGHPSSAWSPSLHPSSLLRASSPLLQSTFLVLFGESSLSLPFPEPSPSSLAQLQRTASNSSLVLWQRRTVWFISALHLFQAVLMLNCSAFASVICVLKCLETTWRNRVQHAEPKLSPKPSVFRPAHLFL